MQDSLETRGSSYFVNWLWTSPNYTGGGGEPMAGNLPYAK